MSDEFVLKVGFTLLLQIILIQLGSHQGWSCNSSGSSQNLKFSISYALIRVHLNNRQKGWLLKENLRKAIKLNLLYCVGN